MLVYSVLKAVFRPALRLFYAEAGTPAPGGVPEAGPLIVVANHPNTLLDPLLVGMLWQRELRFLTSSRFFRGVAGKLLRGAGAIPIQRQHDTATPLPGAERRAHLAAAFAAAHAQLAAGAALLIFPEGTSEPVRGLRPFKHGAARIALEAEARHHWRLGVRLLPVALNYADAPRFRSALTRHVGAPLVVAAYRARYEANPPAAVRALTAALHRALAAELAVSVPPATEALLRALEGLLLPAAANRDAFAPARTLSAALNRLAAHAPARLAGLRARTTALYRTLHRLGLPPGALALAPVARGPMAGRAALLLLGAPVAAWGAANHALATGLPAGLVARLRPAAEFRAAALVVAGLLTAPLAYALQTGWVAWRTHSAALTAAYLLSLPLTGAAAVAWQRAWRLARTRWRLRRLARRRPRLLRALYHERAALLATLGVS